MVAGTFETQFLGVIIQENLKWNARVVELKIKISTSIGIIYKAISLLATTHLKCSI